MFGAQLLEVYLQDVIKTQQGRRLGEHPHEKYVVFRQGHAEQLDAPCVGANSQRHARP